jgi:hypothetical protein
MAGEKIDLDIKKSLHINLTKDTHAALRIKLFENHLSMQEVFENVAIQIVEEDPYMLRLLEKIALQKRENASAKFNKTDAESIYDAIAHEGTS